MNSKFIPYDDHHLMVSGEVHLNLQKCEEFELSDEGWDHLLDFIPEMKNEIDDLEAYGGPKGSLVITFPSVDFRGL